MNVLMTENVALYQHVGFNEIGRIHRKDVDRVYLSMAKLVS